MSLTWNIVSKDFLRMRTAILAWTALMALKILFYASVSGVFGAPSLPWLLRLGEGPLVALRTCLDPFIAFVLAGWLVHEDPLTGADAFWVTRPISGARLLGAKALGGMLLIVALPIALNLPWWLSCGFGAMQIASAMVPMAAEFSAVALVGMGVGSATTSFPRFFLWTIAGFAGLFAVHLMASGLASSGLGFQSTQMIGTGLALTRFLILLSCSLLVCAEIGAFQFLSRHFRRSLPVTVALTVLASAVAFSSQLNFFPHFGWDAIEAPVSGGSANRDSDVDVSVPTGAAGQPVFDGYMTVPMRLAHLAPGMVASWTTQAEWSDGGQSLWKIGGWSGRHQDEIIEDRMRSLVGFTTSTPDFIVDNNFQFPRSLAQKYSGKPLSFRAKVTIYLIKGAIATDKALLEQSFRASGESFSVNDLEIREHTVGATVTSRFERTSLLALFGFVLPRSGTLALVNRAKGEMRVGIQLLGSNPLGIQLNMVSVVSQKLEFDNPSPSWIQDARLVAYTFNADNRVERSLCVDPFRFTYLSPEESKFRLKKAP
jgi:hypothetical protein